MNNRNSSNDPTFECSVYEVQRFVAYLIWKRYFWSERKASEDKNMDDVCLNLLHKALETKHKEINRKPIPVSGQKQGAWVFDRTDTITLHFNDFESKVVWDYARTRIAGHVSAIWNSVQQINVKTFKRLKENIEIAVKKMENVGVFDNEPAFLGFSHTYNQLLGLLYEAASVEIWYHDLEMCMVDDETKKILQMWVPTEFLRSLEIFESKTGIVLYDWDNAEKVEVEELEKKSVIITAYYLNNRLEKRYDKEKQKSRLFGNETESDKYPINICQYVIMFSEHSNKGNSVYINKTALDQVDKCVSYIKLTPQYEEVIKKVVEETNFVKLKNFFERNLVELKSTNLVEVKDFAMEMPERVDLYKMFCLLSCSTFNRQAFLILVVFNDIFEALDNLTLGDTKNMLDLPVKEFAEQDWLANLNKLFQAEKCETLADIWNAMVYAFQDTVFTYDLLREGLYEPNKHNFSAIADPSKIERTIHDKLTILSKISGLGNVPKVTDVEETLEDEAEDDCFSPEDDSCGHHCHLCAARKKCPEYNGHDCDNCPVRFICRTYLEENNVVPHVRRIVIIGRK